MTITYRTIAGGNELEIRATSESPSVSNVLEQYRQTLVLFLLHTGKLSKNLYNAIIADKGEIFKLENRQKKVADTSRKIKKIIDAFFDMPLAAGEGVTIQQAEKPLLKIMIALLRPIYESYKHRSVTWEKKIKSPHYLMMMVEREID